MTLKLAFTYAVADEGADKSMRVEAAPALAARLDAPVSLSAKYPAYYSDEKMLNLVGEAVADIMAERGIAHDSGMTFIRADGMAVHELKIILS